MTATSDATRGLAMDATSLGTLRTHATRDPKAAIRDVARQFEALFLREMLKSMRAASPSPGLMDNEGTKLGTEMLDGELATRASGGAGSLATLIARQLERQMGADPAAAMAPPAHAQPRSAVRAIGAERTAIEPNGSTGEGGGAAAAFVARHGAAAAATAAASGVPARFMLAQAGHESGWGRREILNADGSSSNNLFGIKAGAGWKGPVAEVVTTEFVDGQPRRMVQAFRAYASAADSFADYARLLTHSPRYRDAVAAGDDARAFARGLQRGGYATDPLYAAKLERVIATTARVEAHRRPFEAAMAAPGPTSRRGRGQDAT